MAVATPGPVFRLGPVGLLRLEVRCLGRRSAPRSPVRRRAEQPLMLADRGERPAEGGERPLELLAPSLVGCRRTSPSSARPIRFAASRGGYAQSGEQRRSR